MPRGLFEARVPGVGGIPARTREQLTLAVSQIQEVPVAVWLHEGWLGFLGRRELDESSQPLLDYARACATAGEPLDATVLQAVHPPAVVRSTRAAVAEAVLVALVLDAVRQVVATARGDDSWSWSSTPAAVATSAVGAPLLAPLALAGVAVRLLDAAVGQLPPVETADLDGHHPPASPDAPSDETADRHGSLAADLVAEAVPSYLGHAFVRLALVRAPFRTAVGVRMDDTVATLWVGRGRLTVEPGLHPEAVGVLDGGLDPVLRAVAASIVRDLTPGASYGEV